MDFFLGLMVGLLVGLLLNWVIAPLFDRSKQQENSREADLSQTIRNMEQRLQALEQFQLDKGEDDEQQKEGRIAQVIVRRSDDLQVIKGIGPAFSQRLNESGIHTFQDLAANSPEQIKRMVRAEAWQAVDTDTWVKMARHLADENVTRIENDH